MRLAQLNVAHARFPMDDPRMEGFTGRINAINTIADRSDGFIWRLVDDDETLDGAVNLRLPDDDKALVNMSLWRDMESLYQFVYKTVHVQLIQDRGNWFEAITQQHMALWWVADAHVPTLAEAAARLASLREQGPTPKAFDFDHPFDPEGELWKDPLEMRRSTNAR